MANREVKIRYLKSYDYKCSLTTGIYGGITSTGMINANFFTDRTIIPENQIQTVDEQGMPIGPAVDQKDGDIIREVQFGALIDIHTARIMISWLDAKIEEYDKNFPK